MTRSAEKTTKWVAENISKMDAVLQATPIGPYTIQIVRKKQDPFIAGIISVPVVTREILQTLLAVDPQIELAVNVPKESIWQGTAIEEAVAREVAFGGISDLMSAIAREVEDVRRYVRREYEFVERGLSQHTRVSRLERRFDRVYLVHRKGLRSLQFVMLNEYELTADHVRTARARYGTFDAILINDPNGKPTSGAMEVAKGMGVGIFKWAEFLGRLNRS